MKRTSLFLNSFTMTTMLAFSSMAAQAQDAAGNPAAALQHRYSFTKDASDSVGHADGTLEGAATISGGQVHLDGTRGLCQSSGWTHRRRSRGHV